MSYKKSFIKILEEHYPKNTIVLIADIDQHYQFILKDIRFARTSSNPLDKRLDVSSYFLAMIQVLERQGATYKNIRIICHEVAHDYIRPKTGFHKWVKKLPVKLVNTWFSKGILKWMNKKMSSKGHPDGFLAKVITDKNDTYGLGYGIDILECGICTLFAKHKSSKYTSILCEIDEITSNQAGLKLVRSGTIALEAKKCDFRFKLIEK